MNTKSKCDFCKYFTGRSCMVRPTSYYCKDATNEYYIFLKNNGAQDKVKSLRKWDRK